MWRNTCSALRNLTSKYAAPALECFSFDLAINISQNTDHHSKRNPPGASIAAESNSFYVKLFGEKQSEFIIKYRQSPLSSPR